MTSIKVLFRNLPICFVSYLFSAFASASIVTDTAMVEFGMVGLHSMNSRTIYVYNSESTETFIDETDNCSTGAFKIYNTCMGYIYGNGYCTIDLYFSPTTAGHQSCAVTLHSTTGGYASVNVSGDGQ